MDAQANLVAQSQQKKPAPPPKDDDDDDVDLFGSDSEEEESEAAAKIREERLAAYNAKKSKSMCLGIVCNFKYHNLLE